MLEKLLAAIVDLTTALNANTAARTGTESPAAPAKPAKPAKPAAAAPAAPAAQALAADVGAAPLPSRAEVAAVITELADAGGEKRAKAVAILGEFGAKSLKEIKDDVLGQLFAKVKAAKAAFEGAGQTASLV